MRKDLHISGSLLFFVLLLRLISNLLISDERSLKETIGKIVINTVRVVF